MSMGFNKRCWKRFSGHSSRKPETSEEYSARILKGSINSTTKTKLTSEPDLENHPHCCKSFYYIFPPTLLYNCLRFDIMVTCQFTMLMLIVSSYAWIQLLPVDIAMASLLSLHSGRSPQRPGNTFASVLTNLPSTNRRATKLNLQNIGGKATVLFLLHIPQEN